MLDSFLGVLGILISVVLFALGYKQTVGAKKERIRSANQEIEKILVRRIVIESYAPARLDIERLLQGKARDFRVSEAELLSEGQQLNAVYTRIVESDLIPTGQREEILDRILPALIEAEASVHNDDRFSNESVSRSLRSPTATLGAIAAIASLIGGIISVYPEISSSTMKLTEVFSPALLTIVLSLLVLSSAILIFRLRASQEATTSRAGEQDRYAGFEKDVVRTLEKLKTQYRTAKIGEGADFVLDQSGKRFLLEVKSWRGNVPKSIIYRTAQFLTERVRNSNADGAIIVVPESLNYSNTALENSAVRILSLRELRDFVAHST